ncbi:YceI family protein [Amycolatopsis sp. NPDC059021]|uniref:YceI family protein n=1 Tax=Amycolatopsis sp. NPDC059021 TaxID=3346704 RepID=UPI00366F65E1
MQRTVSTKDSVEIPAEGTYRIDPGRSTISFGTRHVFGLLPAHGTFALREGFIRVADPVTESSAWAKIPAKSFDTGNPARDRTVRSGQYLDADRHPDITFTSTRLARTGEGWFLHGSLTVRGNSNELELRVESARTADSRLKLRATCRVDRYAFGVTKMKGMTGRYLTFRLDLTADRA